MVVFLKVKLTVGEILEVNKFVFIFTVRDKYEFYKILILVESSARGIGLLLDNKLNITEHVKSVCKAAYASSQLITDSSIFD